MTARAIEARKGLWFASPWIFGFVVFLLYPLLASLYYSFCDYSVLKNPVWVGFENYTELFHDDVFWTTIKNTAIFTAISLPLGLILALALAMLLNVKVKGLAIYRTIFYLPSLIPLVGTAVLWMWVFNGKNGIVNNLLSMVHVHGPDWLNDPLWSKPSIILLSLWGAGNTMVIYLAGLQDVPQSLYEAAELDGAKGMAKTWHVTLPMISPVILFNLIMGIIGSLQIFAVPYVISSEGAPARSIYFYTMYLYDNAFRYHKMGYACAMGWIMFIVIFLMTLLSWRLSERHVHYGAA